VKCDVCDQEFDTEVELDKHKAEMHASEPAEEMKPIDVTAAEDRDEQLEEPAHDRGVNE